MIPKYIGISYNDINNWIKNGGSIRNGKEHSACWHMMFDTRTIQDNNLRFDKNLSLGEDTIFSNTYLLYESSLCNINNVFYTLLQREDGANLSHLNNVRKRVSDKIKLVNARERLNLISQKLYSKNLSKYYQGTNVLSCMEIAVRLMLDGSIGSKEKRSLYRQFITHPLVSQSLRSIDLPLCKRALPFKLIKKNNGWLFYWLVQMLPKTILKKVIM